jgi:hypothetical protein
MQNSFLFATVFVTGKIIFCIATENVTEEFYFCTSKKILEYGQQKIEHAEAANGLQQESQETSKNNPHAALQGKNNPSATAVNSTEGRNGDYTPQ